MVSGLWYPAALTAIALVLLLVEEYRDHRAGVAIFKLLASSGFVACALAAGAARSAYGQWVLAALVLSWFGDAFLLSRRGGWFRVGLFGFLAAHLAFAGAFVEIGVAPAAVGVAGVVLAVVGAIVAWRLLPGVERPLRSPVVAYIAVISAMVALGFGAFVLRGAWVLLVAPVGFYLSDLTVARDRFLRPGFVNRLVGLPLYYGSQILFAWSVSSVPG